MTKSINRKSVIVLALIVALIVSTASVFAAEYTNKKSFSIKLPHTHANATAATANKTTSRNYGKMQVTKIGGGSKGINAWFRSMKNGSWDPLTSKLRSFTQKGTKVLYYKNSDTGYTIPHGKGVKAQARVENKTKTQFIKDSVEGNVWFN